MGARNAPTLYVFFISQLAERQASVLTASITVCFFPKMDSLLTVCMMVLVVTRSTAAVRIAKGKELLPGQRDVVTARTETHRMLRWLSMAFSSQTAVNSAPG